MRWSTLPQAFQLDVSLRIQPDRLVSLSPQDFSDVQLSSICVTAREPDSRESASRSLTHCNHRLTLVNPAVITATQRSNSSAGARRWYRSTDNLTQVFLGRLNKEFPDFISLI